MQGDADADVIVVGAGPGGASAAYHLAQAGVSVLVVDKARFPRDKICGDGLTPAAVREILAMGIDPNAEDGWQFNRGLTVIGGGHTIHLPWPEQPSLPNYGMARMRSSLDERLLRQAQQAGARVWEETTVTGAVRGRTGRLEGVNVTQRDENGKRLPGKSLRARYVIDAGGVAAKLSNSVGITKENNRPLAVAARAYFRSPRANEEWMESHLELWDGRPGESTLLPGYGWIFPLGNGYVNVGLGSVSSGAQATTLPYKKIFHRWISHLPEEWQITPETQEGPLRSAALPMCLNREPHYRDGLVIIGDAGGMVSPFNGEGIAPAMFAGRHAAATIVQALGRHTYAGAEAAMSQYPHAIRSEYGGYYSLGRIFVRLIENPKIMRLCTKYGLTHPQLMRFVHKLLSDGYERHGGDGMDRIIQALTALAPKV